MRVFELEEAAEASKAKMAVLEERSINQEVQLGRVEAELLQQAKRFEEAEAELTGDVVDAYDARFEDALAQVTCVHPEMDVSPFVVSNRVINGQIVPRILPFSLYLVVKRTIYCPPAILLSWMSSCFYFLKLDLTENCSLSYSTVNSWCMAL